MNWIPVLINWLILVTHVSWEISKYSLVQVFKCQDLMSCLVLNDITVKISGGRTSEIVRNIFQNSCSHLLTLKQSSSAAVYCQKHYKSENWILGRGSCRENLWLKTLWSPRETSSVLAASQKHHRQQVDHQRQSELLRRSDGFRQATVTVDLKVVKTMKIWQDFGAEEWSCN